MSGEAGDRVVGGPPHREDARRAAVPSHHSTPPDISADGDAGFVDVAAVRDLPDGTLLGVTLPTGEPVCLYSQGGVIGAIGDRCTHAEFAMSDGVLHADGTVECIWHGARFDCRTGAVRRQPASEPLPVYPVRVANGRVRVRGTPGRVGAP